MPAIIWKLVTCQWTTSKNTRPRQLSPEYGQMILVSGNPVLQLSIDHNVDVQSVFSWVPKLARKCESKHWLPCGADGRSLARCTVTRFTNFLGWVDLLSFGAPLKIPLTIWWWLKHCRNVCHVSRKFEILETEQRQALEAFISGRNMIAILMLKASPY